MKIIILGALPSSLYNFRGELIRSLSQRAEVISMACGADDSCVEVVEKLGCKYIDYPVSRNGLNLIKDIKTVFSLVKVFKETRPDIVFSYTVKPIIWGGIAARVTNVKSFFPMVTGLGFAFQPGGWFKNLLTKLVSFLYKVALKRAKFVIFQNADNMNSFVDAGIVPVEKCVVINGSGVDLKYFKKEPVVYKPKFLLIARLLGDKGIREYAKAAELVKYIYPLSEFHLVGPEDSSPDGIEVEEVHMWHSKGIVYYHGPALDVRPFIKDCGVFVLPSYHEGMPRTILEAMAMGRPVLTTNVPGCKETVLNGENGWLVEKANVDQLVERMIWYIENIDLWQGMGDRSHEIVKERFDVHKVNAKILQVMGFENEKAV